MSEMEKYLVKLGKINQVFRIGVALSLCGLFLLLLGEVSLYNGLLLVARWTNEMALYSGLYMFLFGFSFIVITILAFRKYKIED